MAVGDSSGDPASAGEGEGAAPKPARRRPDRPARNLFVEGTSLARLERVPPVLDALWARAHARQGASVRTCRALVDGFARACERLGLALVAAEKLEGVELESLEQRLLSVAVFELTGGVLPIAEALVRLTLGADLPRGAEASLPWLADPAALAAIAERDPALEERLRAQRPRIRRLDALAREAVDPARLRFVDADGPLAQEPPAADAIEVTERGVSVRRGVKRRWTPLEDLALDLCADVANLIESVAQAALRAYAAGRGPAFDAVLERV